MNSMELAVHNLSDANILTEVLLANNYICMVSREEGLYIVNAIWSHNCNRNDVVFMDTTEFEEEYIERGELDD